jgi:sugar lactone lactonase YvrE/DNA-binding CsgD family transcriptional regulator
MKTSTRTGYHRRSGPWQPSPAQQRVLEGVAAGESNPAIAERLGLSQETVKSHVAALLAETGSADRAELAQWWQERQQLQVGGRSYGWLFRLALAALLLIGLALAAGLLVLLVAPGGARSHSLARRPTAVSTAARTPTAPAEAAAPAPTATPSPADPASSPTGSGPAVFVWASDGGLADFRPYMLALDAQDNLYAIDVRSSRIVKFDPNGTVLTTWGSVGTGNGQFDFNVPPTRDGGIAIAADGTVLVVDDTGRVQQFTGDGRLLGVWPSCGKGSAPGQFSWPTGIAVARDGTVYIGDGRGADRIQVFAPDGSLRAVWGSSGSGPGEFAQPTPCAVDHAGNLYVADNSNSRVVELDARGQVVRTVGSAGNGPGEFLGGLRVALDGAGNLYMTDNDNARAQKFDAQGRYLGEWGSLGHGPGSMWYPNGIVIDSHGDIYVADTFNNRIQKFHPR